MGVGRQEVVAAGARARAAAEVVIQAQVGGTPDLEAATVGADPTVAEVSAEAAAMAPETAMAVLVGTMAMQEQAKGEAVVVVTRVVGKAVVATAAAVLALARVAGLEVAVKGAATQEAAPTAAVQVEVVAAAAGVEATMEVRVVVEAMAEVMMEAVVLARVEATAAKHSEAEVIRCSHSELVRGVYPPSTT